MTGLQDGIVVVGFAGGGGSSEGIKQAIGRDPDVGINHDPPAIAMHAANHPSTRHYCQNIWRADPCDVAAGRRVALAWFSPDCKHFSKAKGGRPVSRNIRDLAWVVVLWARRVRPAVLIVENVEEFQQWGPVDLDGRPCRERAGATFRQWVAELRRGGYRVEWRELRACDYGSPTIRKRLIVVARCDGLPIAWPAPTHGAPQDPETVSGRLQPWRTAAQVIDWSLPCPSIFLTPEAARALKAAGGPEVRRPLAAATLRRIARGTRRFVLDAAEPFIVPITHRGDDRVHGLAEPLRTVTTTTGGEFSLVAPTLVQMGYGERAGQAPRVPGLDKPLGTVVAGGCKHALVAAFLAQHNTGVTGHDARRPLSTITMRGTQQQIVAGHLVHLRHHSDARSIRDPLPTLTAGGGRGGHVAEVRAFLTKYYGADQAPQLTDPMHTVTTLPRFGLVTVTIAGEPWILADIGMRMLTPRELFRAQGFPDSYVIDLQVDGRPLSKAAQIRMAGNSVCPDVARALVAANLPAVAAGERVVA
ncbi:MAG: DNA cytosine methyltransferase [Sneathiellaceae bacterium]